MPAHIIFDWMKHKPLKEKSDEDVRSVQMKRLTSAVLAGIILSALVVLLEYLKVGALHGTVASVTIFPSFASNHPNNVVTTDET